MGFKRMRFTATRAPRAFRVVVETALCLVWRFPAGSASLRFAPTEGVAVDDTPYTVPTQRASAEKHPFSILQNSQSAT